MKKVNLFIVALVAMFGFCFSAFAAQDVSLSCEGSKTIKIGESRLCTVSITSQEAVQSAVVTISAGQHLAISDPKANTSAGWTASSVASTDGSYSFNNTTGVTSGQVFSFKVTLKDSAKQLSAGDSCGELCISSAKFNDMQLTVSKGTGTCFIPTYVVEECPNGKCTENPKTGEFLNYAIIGGVLVIGVAAVVVARKNTKFFRI